jgi:hypothetical protein
MTVCIAVECSEEAIVGISDAMLSMPDMSADSLAIKVFSVADSWIATFSANDMTPVIGIYNAVRSQLAGSVSLAEVVRAFQDVFRKELLARAEGTILAPLGISMSEFRQSGLQNFGPEIFSRLFYQIEQLSLEVTFLVYGFENETPHIFSVQNRGEISYFDQPGFWAIGSGQTTALGSLFSYSPPITYRKLEEVLYLACKAKFLAECAPGVGRKTHGLILLKNGDRFALPIEKIAELRELWDSNKPPDVPDLFRIKAKAMIDEFRTQATQSVSQTSGPVP